MTIDPKYVTGSEEWNADRANEYRKVFGISSDNTLELTGYSNSTRHMRDDDDYSFVEKDQEGNVVARYEAWHHMSTPKSFSASSGYKKFSPEGELIEQVGR
ncbi:hypothetical protein [Vibrio aestuarianus]|uniref:Uncharacterized protein n=1 Tax=Vibrio aestuarianus TaxID=28171 RepID=A0ABD7YQM9_9VIBR|nr:hypothetical protein [Vibrio aestuarianus]WGK87404.1 hypothetical protein PYE67_14895 [Vibrio aestuarianus]CAH8187893.1 hypothetical protein VAEU17_110002 [Vibrio aestuarianus]